jgi:hypothetical protein
MLNSDTKLTVGVVLALISALSSYVYAMFTLPDKSYVDNKVSDIKEDVRYIRNQVDDIKKYLLEIKK